MCCHNQKNVRGVVSLSWLLALWLLLSFLVIHFSLPLRAGSSGLFSSGETPPGRESSRPSASLKESGRRPSLALAPPSEGPNQPLLLRDGTGPHTFLATAYCLPGQTASGLPVGPGVIAADPDVLPLGSIVRLFAGRYSGTYTVLDTGAKVRGRMVDIWMPSEEEARRFGVRKVRLQILRYGWKGSPQGTIPFSAAPAPRESPSSERHRGSR